MEITELTVAERRVWDAFPCGEAVDFRSSPDDDPADGAGWGPERTVRGEVLRAIVLGCPRADDEIAMVVIEGARISGQWSLRHGTIDCPLLLSGCYFDSAPDLYAAHLVQVNLARSVLPGLVAAGAQFDGSLDLSACRVSGMVALSAARVSKVLSLNQAHLGTEDAEGQGTVLTLNHSVVDDDIVANGVLAHGEVRLDSATVRGLINFDDAVLQAPGRIALRAESLSAGGDVTAARLVASGTVRLGAARVEGSVSVEDAQLLNVQGDALDAAHLTVGTVLNAGGLTAEGRVRLTGAKVSGWVSFIEARLRNPGGVALGISNSEAALLTLRDAAPILGDVKLHYSSFKVIEAHPRVWPGVVRLEGLNYEALAPRLPAAHRLALLARDADGFVPHAYEQLAASYRQVGDDAAARTVQLAKQRRHRATLPAYARLWGWAQDITVGYGFRPIRAAAWLFSLLFLGTLAYALHHPTPLKAGEAPDFNPVIYTLDLLLPIIDFGQEKAYSAHGWYQWLGYALIITGWLLATTIAAGITRTVSRS
ncbi:membrane-associated oxidoreductase [Streptomyces erythrochromogenes]|uniref:membrane-associated oxidoreductase n=1 Tax=Streptomyces erythrochromogenes TaxID=285574 RepID=UPI00331F6B0D